MTSIDTAIFEQRLTRVQERMAAVGIDLLVIGPSADFRYLTGHAAHTSERLTALLIPQHGESRLVVPRLEAPLYAALDGRLAIDAWDETDDPIARIAATARVVGGATLAVNDDLWSGFLLRIQAALPGHVTRSASVVLAPLRAVKDAAELTLLREASRRTDAAWEEFCFTTRLPGMTERGVADRLRALMAAHGIPEVAFCIVGSGPNGASPHHLAGNRVIERGDPVVIDFGGVYEGYYSDITRTPVAGEPEPAFVGAYETVLRAQQAAFEAIRPGTPCQEVDRAARRVITAAGFGDAFLHRVGHGLGLTEHESPYLVEGNTEPLRPGMVVSDEPGIYLAGRWGIRIEDSVAVTADGAERLNTVSRDLTVLG